jgi:hypothetical protein
MGDRQRLPVWVWVVILIVFFAWIVYRISVT